MDSPVEIVYQVQIDEQDIEALNVLEFLKERYESLNIQDDRVSE